MKMIKPLKKIQDPEGTQHTSRATMGLLTTNKATKETKVIKAVALLDWRAVDLEVDQLQEMVMEMEAGLRLQLKDNTPCSQVPQKN